MQVDWYFDFISPFSYLQFLKLERLPAEAELTLKPVLFAGLLEKHGQKGPAEIPEKRLFTYRHVIWRARRDGIPFNFPRAHPFNPIRALRLAVALGSGRAAVGPVFDAIWCKGLLPDDEADWRQIQHLAGVDDGEARIAEPAVKKALIANGEAALAAGVFGVPSLVADGQVFWGDDATDFFIDWLNDRSILDSQEMRALDGLPSSATRI